jgi:hypothetical protein
VKPRVYLSASSAELTRARVARDALRELGVEVVGIDWIDAVAAHGSLGLGLSQDDRNHIAYLWMSHIRACDVLLALVPEDGAEWSHGSLTGALDRFRDWLGSAPLGEPWQSVRERFASVPRPAPPSPRRTVGSDGLVAEVTMARCLGRPVVLASRVPRERLHPALLCAEWRVFGDDFAALTAAYRMARRS